MERDSIFDWLMTYGWIILVVLIAIGTLIAYFGVFNPDISAIEKTTTTINQAETTIQPTSTFESTTSIDSWQAHKAKLAACDPRAIRRFIDPELGIGEFCDERLSKIILESDIVIDDDWTTTTSSTTSSTSTTISTTSSTTSTSSTTTEETTSTIEKPEINSNSWRMRI